MNLGQIVASPQFKIIGIPALFVAVGVYAKLLSRRDNDPSPWLDAWAVSTSTLLMTIGTIVADLQQKDADVQKLASWLVGVIFFVLISIEHERNRSWKIDPDNPKKLLPERKPFVGVLIPDLLSMAIFIAYQAAKP